MSIVKPRAPKVKRLPVNSTVDATVKLTLEARGIDINKAIEHFLNETAGHFVCPTCGALLRPTKKG